MDEVYMHLPVPSAGLNVPDCTYSQDITYLLVQVRMTTYKNVMPEAFYAQISSEKSACKSNLTTDSPYRLVCNVGLSTSYLRVAKTVLQYLRTDESTRQRVA